MLDTDTLIDLVRGKPQIAARYVQAQIDAVSIVLSTVSPFEFRCGMERSRRHAIQAPALERLLTSLTLAPFDADDVMIAAQAIQRDLTLVTGNLREFSRVAGLKIEDWREA